MQEMRKLKKLNGLSKFGDRIRTIQVPDSLPSEAKNLFSYRNTFKCEVEKTNYFSKSQVYSYKKMEHDHPQVFFCL